MRLRNIVNYILIFCFFTVPTVVWLRHFHPFIAMKEFIFSACIIIASGFMIIHFIMEGKVVIRKSRIFFAVLLFYLYNFLSFFIFEYTDLNYLILLTNLVLLFYIVSYFTTMKYRNIIIHVLIIVSVFSSIYSFFQFIGIDYGFFVDYFGSRSEYGMRTFSFFGNPNLLGGFSIFMIPLIAVFFIKAIQEKKKHLLFYFGFALVLAFSALLMSQTRGSWIAFFFTAIFFVMLYYRRRLYALFHGRKKLTFSIIIIVVVLVAYGMVIIKNRMEFVSGEDETFVDPTSLNIRLFYYQNTLNMIRGKLLFGRGIGTFNVYYPSYRDNRVAARLGEVSMEFRVEHAHNEHLELLSDLGIVGYLLFLWIIFEALYLLLRKDDIISLGIAVSIIGLLLDGLLMQNLRFIVIASLFWLVLGFSAIGSPRKTGKSNLTLIKIGLIIFVVVVMFFGLRYAYGIKNSDFQVRGGIGYYLSSDPNRFGGAIHWFEESLAVDPYNKRALYYIAATYKDEGDSWKNKGDMDNAIQNYQKSMEYYERLLAIDPNFIQVRYHLGQMYIELGYLDKAQEQLEEHIKTNNMYWRSYFILAFIENQHGNKKEAIGYLEEIIEIHEIYALHWQDRIQVFRLLSTLYFEEKEYNKALNILLMLQDIEGGENVKKMIEDVREIIDNQ